MNWASLSQAERDAAYNNGAAVRDSAAQNNARREASAAYRAAHPATLDIAYGEKEREKFDFFLGSDPAAPCLVFIHGGYWQMNRREDFANMAEGVAAHGWHVALPGYTLAPEASLHEIVSEILAALDFLSAHRAEYGMTGKIILAGWSAGAQLAAVAMAHTSVDAALLISGVYELAPLRDTYLNEKLQLTDQEIDYFSPLRQKMVDKPAVIAYGTMELAALVEDAKMLHAARLVAKAVTMLLPIEGADHFTILRQLTAPNGALTAQLLALE
jgi:acetyl esterase/lipase